MTFRIWFVNFNYYDNLSFSDIKIAIARGADKGFDFRVDRWIDDAAEPVCSWSYFGGLRWIVREGLV